MGSTTPQRGGGGGGGFTYVENKAYMAGQPPFLAKKRKEKKRKDFKRKERKERKK